MATWKAFERRAAKLFGCTRAPLSGGNGKVTRSDSLHDSLFISCKHSKRSSLWTLFTTEKSKAVAENKTTVLAIHLKGAHGMLITAHSDDFEKVALAYLLANNICAYSNGTLTIFPQDISEEEMTELVKSCSYNETEEED